MIHKLHFISLKGKLILILKKFLKIFWIYLNLIIKIIAYLISTNFNFFTFLFYLIFFIKILYLKIIYLLKLLLKFKFIYLIIFFFFYKRNYFLKNKYFLDFLSLGKVLYNYLIFKLIIKL